MAAPDMRVAGNCINCDHAVNLHPRRPTGKCPNVKVPTESITALTCFFSHSAPPQPQQAQSKF